MTKKKYPKPQVIGFMPMVKDGNEIWGFEISELSEEKQNDFKKVVCPRANECGDECFYPIHKTPHQFLEDGCNRITIGHACPACIPVWHAVRNS